MDEFKDRILGGDGKARFNIVRKDGTIVESDVEIVLSSIVLQEGDKFGAKEVNKLLALENGCVVLNLFTEGY